MSRVDPVSSVQMFPGELRVLRIGRPLRLAVVHGRLWITRTGDLDDHFLGPGEAITLARGDRVWVGAESASRWQLLGPVPSAVRHAAARRPSWPALWRRWFGAALPLLR
jgi:hypothetical protein